MSATVDGGRKMVPGQAPAKKKGVKENRDEELALFADMHKREKDRLVSLLQPVSDDSIEGYSLYHRSTVHGNVPKGPTHSSFGYGFPAEKFDSKNDYDWLKTPPATPLFPSLEIEAVNGHTLVVQRELPILQPLSRFSGNNSSKTTTPTKKMSDDESSSVATKGKAPPRLRSTTPTPRFPTVSSSSQERKTNINTSKPSTKNTQNLNKSLDNYNTNIGIKLKHMTNINGSSLSRSTGEGKSLTSIESKAKATFPTNETTKIPSNLRTSGRSYSASRGRPGLVITNNNQKTNNPVSSNPDHILGKNSGSYCDESTNNRGKSTMKSRQSCSPSVTRGRKPAAEQLAKQDNNSKTNVGVISRTGTQFVGSKMVEKMMNARNMKSNVGTTNNKFA